MFSLYPQVKCLCGNNLYFPNGWYPEYVVCQNCGQTIPVVEIMKGEKNAFPNIDMNKPKDELLKDLFIQAVDEARKTEQKKNMKVIDGGNQT